GGDWKKVKTTQDHTDMSGKFGSLKEGGHYYYKYRLYKTIDGKDYYSKWSDYMIDDYTGWE
ncbi:MAG: hypothetical protein K6G83_10555, partial [Lachnospiraceae bacterium]|nr:hypothetical protein [Lachnospiraceae bacterium]